jgi:hypothetical protein
MDQFDGTQLGRAGLLGPTLRILLFLDAIRRLYRSALDHCGSSHGRLCESCLSIPPSSTR